MKHKRLLGTAAILAGLLLAGPAGSADQKSESESGSKGGSGLLRVYEVNKQVKDFPEKEDMSTPESAYAAINRLMASGDEGGWRRLSTSDNQDGAPPANAPKKTVDPRKAEMCLNARIVEVRVFHSAAAVLAEMLRPTGEKEVDYRFLRLEGGRWLNKGNDGFENLAQAREHFALRCTQIYREDVRPHRGPIANPEACLRPFVDFLKSRAEDPRTFVLNALDDRQIVILGEIHHRPLYWQFNCSLLTDPAFSKSVGTIYMELPMNDQPLVDRFLASGTLDTTPVIDTLRDIFEMGWPDQAMLDFFQTVWIANKSLPQAERIRIVFVDMKRPWKDIQKRGDWVNYDTDRDKLMAESILQDRQNHPNEKRHGLFLVGYGHAMLDLRYIEGTPLQSAGWHLREKLGADGMLSIIPHGPSIPNIGPATGRRCLGLFDSAFAAVGNKPMAFALSEGPFGEQVFDADPGRPTASLYRDGYSAYLYLGPLEYEMFSPLIAGFYTPGFVQEFDRRWRLMNGKGWAEQYQTDMNVESVIRWMSGSWGKPRDWIGQLGPVNAWQYGDDWETKIRDERHKYALAHPEVVREAALRLLNAIRSADYDHASGDWEHFPSDVAGTVEYMVDHWYPDWVSWICKTFKASPIESVEVAESVTCTKDDPYGQGGEPGLPTIGYKLTLKGGRTMAGELPFYWEAREQTWCGYRGLDWHLGVAPPQ